ncbi:putative bifunctional diguanylate cyclase/phosphodiesterase [Agaribacterium haliotis]|uniref:putative bifunctional diguanylate cyclase/phosphodiesterase n=1 Tax=Agaribacterium haliotis TaxID=2013869 RepID=UPI000BB553F0|nr:EAL domain-containing protein [Agaribacterium haliotis]
MSDSLTHFTLLNAVLYGALLVALCTLWQRGRKRKQQIQQAHKQSNALANSQARLHADNQKLTASIDSLRTELELLYQKQHQQAELGSHTSDFYRKIFDHSPIFCIALSDSLHIDDINQSACNSLNYRFSDLLNMRFLDLVEPGVRPVVAGLLDQVKDGLAESCRCESILLDHHKKPLHVVLHLHRISRHYGETTIAFCEDISESRELSLTLAYQAHHDELTGLKNRRALEQYVDEKLSTREKSTKLSLIYFDIDQFKVVNDTCGHSAGDQLLKQLIAVLSPCIEKEQAFFARIGGDEFALILENRSRQQIELFAEALRDEAEAFSFRWDGRSFRQSISIGVVISNNCDKLSTMLSAADAACHSAKEHGRNQIHICAGANENNGDQQAMRWVSRLDEAINDNKFVLNFQPIVAINKPYAHYVHYEVLIQYRDDVGNLVQPSQFLPPAERYGKSSAIDLWVVKQTFAYLKKHPEHFKGLACCSVNLTSHTIADERARDIIIAQVRNCGFPANKICFEITESSAMQNLNEAIDFMRTLRALGCRFALDDFGTGFSSFSYLKNLDVDYLKIDGSFVQDLIRDKIAHSMIRAISEVAKEMNIKTVAEYVENDLVMKELKTLGIDYAQGFGIAKPMPLEALSDFYFAQEEAEAELN